METTETTPRAIVTLTPVKSSTILAIGHDAESSTLTVEFKRKSPGRSIYQYANVDSAVFESFENAVASKGSVGIVFGSVIKAHSDKFPFVRIADDDTARFEVKREGGEDNV